MIDAMILQSIRRHLTVCIILFVSIIQAVYGLYFAAQDSATVDEVAHIADAYALVQYQDNRLNPEHPPLLKTLAGMMVVAQFPAGIERTESWQTADQWIAGRELLYWQGNDADALLFWGRFPTVVITIAWSVLMLFFARQFFSMRTAWVVYGLAVIYPDVLGHGHYITTDMMATFGYTLVMYTYVRVLKTKSASWWWLALALVIAQLSKFSSVLLLGMLPIIGVLWRRYVDRQRWQFAFRATARELSYAYAVMIVGIWIVYIPLTMHMSASMVHYLIDVRLSWIEEPWLWVPNVLHWLAQFPIVRAFGVYALGVSMVMLRVAGGNNTFIFGEMDTQGIWWFFPVAWLVKTPVGLIFLYLLGIYAACRLRLKKEVLIISSVVLIVYWAVTLKGSLNLGTRHLLPTVPYVLFMIGYAWDVLWTRGRVWKGVLIAATTWATMSVMANAAHPLAYMNEVSLWVPRHEILVDSALDWGQDLKRLARYLEEHGITEVYVDYFGGGDVEREIPYATRYHAEYGPTTGYLAVSATFLPFSEMVGEREGKWSYSWLKSFTPVASIGHSILLYHLTEQDFIDHPPISPYPFGNK